MLEIWALQEERGPEEDAHDPIIYPGAGRRKTALFKPFLLWFFFFGLQSERDMAAKAKHTILLVQHGADPRTRTFFDYEAVSLMLDGESS